MKTSYVSHSICVALGGGESRCGQFPAIRGIVEDLGTVSIREYCRQLNTDLVALRRELHQIPEVGLHLPLTQARILKALEGLPLEITLGRSLSSIVAVLRGTAPGGGERPVVLLRGDMDAAAPMIEWVAKYRLLEGLRARFAALKTVAAERREAVSAERAAAKEQALKERTAIVERAEAIAEQDPARTQWKNSGAELRELLESWKAAQRRGPRLDRPTEDGLWKRFSHARTTFDRHRRQFFSELDAKQAQVRAAKEALIKRAEEMQTSTDWAGTSAKYRDLLAEWKKAGRASRKEDDALWARFRAAQQVFYDARRAKDEAVDAEFAENLKVKEALVAKAEALLPIKDIKAAKKALRPIQDAWEEAGRVPRGAVRRIEGRMRAVEDAIREAENAEWRRTDPETKARAEGLAGQLQDAIAGLEKDLAAWLERASGLRQGRADHPSTRQY